MKIWRMLLALSLWGISQLAISQCQCGEDVEGPQFDAPTYKLFNLCEAVNEYEILNPSDNCTLEPFTEFSIDTLSHTYCGLVPISGSSCGFELPWNLFFENFPEEIQYFTSNKFGLRTYPNNEAVIYGELVSLNNPNAKIQVELALYDGLNWDQYYEQNNANSYWSQCFNIGDGYLDWTYYKLDGIESFIVGLGDLAGTSFTLNHEPSDFTFAFQVGQRANGHTVGYGMSGQFSFDGFLSSQSLEISVPRQGVSTLVAELTCCAAPFTEISYFSSDECGNTTEFKQNIEVIDHQLPLLLNPIGASTPLVCEGYSPWQPQYEDNCGPVVQEIVNTSNASWYIAQDQCGNSLVSKVVVDVLPPLGENCSYFGCTDPTAPQYNPNALIGDGTCFWASVNVRAFLDLNMNGVLNAGEPGIAGAEIMSNADFGITTTNADGQTIMHYYTNESNNQITINLAPIGYTGMSTPNCYIIDPANPPNTVFFGVAPQPNLTQNLIVNLVSVTRPCDPQEWSLILDVYNPQTFTVSGALVTINLPSYCLLISADNLVAQVGQEITIATSDIEQGESGRYKVSLQLIPNLLGTETEILLTTTIQEQNVSVQHFFPSLCEGDGAAILTASPYGFEDEHFITAQSIEYYFIYTAPQNSSINSFDLAIFPNPSLLAFDPSTIAANHAYTVTLSYNPERYDLHFDNINLQAGDVLSITYLQDASGIDENLEIFQNIQYLAGDNFGASNDVVRNLIDCRDHSIEFNSNLDQCITEVQIESVGLFYNQFHWYIDDLLIDSLSQSIAIPIDTNLNSIRLVASNMLCNDELALSVDEIFTPRFIQFPVLPEAFCENESVLVVPASNANSLIWYLDDVQVANAAEYLVDHTATISAEAPAFGPCPAAVAQWSFTEIPLPQVNLVFLGDSLLCPGELIDVSVFSLLDTFNLFFNDNQILGNSLQIDQAGTITLISSNECGIDQAIQTFIPTPNPAVAFQITGETAFCEGDFVNLNVTGEGNIVVVSGESEIFNFPFNVYNSTLVVATATNDCGSETIELNVNAYPTPLASFSYDQITQTLTAGGSGQYQWYQNGLPIPNATNATYTITETAAYALEIISDQGCVDLSSTEFINYIHVAEHQFSPLIAYPNPTENICLVTGLENAIHSKLYVFDAKGALVYEQKITSNSISIDMSQWLPGLYHFDTLTAQCRVLKK
jgi:hypothetical protein